MTLDINARQDDNRTSLHNFVIQMIDKSEDEAVLQIVNFMIDHGADISAQDCDGETPLHLVAKWGRTSMLEVLLLRGADANARNHKGETPLHVASKIKKMRLLLEHNADPNVISNDGVFALHPVTFIHPTRPRMERMVERNNRKRRPSREYRRFFKSIQPLR